MAASVKSEEKVEKVRFEVKVDPDFARFLRIAAGSQSLDLSKFIESALHKQYGPSLVATTLASIPSAF